MTAQTRIIHRCRLGSGLVMLTYLFFHLINHALANISLDVAEVGLTIAKTVWYSWPGTILLYGAAAIHLSLAVYTLYGRQSWRLPLYEWVRLYAGFSLPVLLIQHAVTVRLGASLYGYDATYRNVVSTIVATGSQGWQLALLAPGWMHGCMGLWLNLRRFAWARHAKPLLISFVTILPLLSALGFARMVNEIALDPSGGFSYYVPDDDHGASMRAGLNAWRAAMLRIYLGTIAIAILAGFVRRHLARTPPRSPQC
jgi:adenylate cyclase